MGDGEPDIGVDCVVEVGVGVSDGDVAECEGSMGVGGGVRVR